MFPTQIKTHDLLVIKRLCNMMKLWLLESLRRNILCGLVILAIQTQRIIHFGLDRILFFLYVSLGSQGTADTGQPGSLAARSGTVY